MPSEIGNQSVRGSGGAQVGAHFEEGDASRLVVLTFEDAAQAEDLYKQLKELDKKKIIKLEDAVFVTTDENGKHKIDEKIHHEKRSGMAKGAILGVLVGWMLGGPVLGLAGGAIVGRMVGKRMDLGIDEGTIKTITSHLESGKTALFLMVATHQLNPVLDAFKGHHGQIIDTTVEADIQAKLQHALDEDSAEAAETSA